MRGTKLQAWRLPPVILNAKGDAVEGYPGSDVPGAQTHLLAATRRTLDAIAKDVREGLAETVGVKATLAIDEHCSMVISFPLEAGEFEPERVAEAIDSENVEAWCDDERRIHVGISPWFSAKDVDQVVLSTTKVIHVMLGLHESDIVRVPPKGLMKKFLTSAHEVLSLQKRLADKD